MGACIEHSQNLPLLRPDLNVLFYLGRSEDMNFPHSLLESAHLTLL